VELGVVSRVPDAVDATAKAINILPYVPAGPLLIWVMGLKDAKSGRMPTDAEHAALRRVFAEALDAGGCGWSAQRTPPSGGAAVQRDYGGTPMVTDLMHDETAFELCRVLRERRSCTNRATSAETSCSTSGWRRFRGGRS
jgi:N-acyl-D-aspartate/D-glutamate deacylase